MAFPVYRGGYLYSDTRRINKKDREMIIKAEAMTGTEFHSSIWKNADGSCQRWRANGACKTWVTREREFRLPVKYGLRNYGYITHDNAGEFHMPDECHIQYRAPLPWYHGLDANEVDALYDYLIKWGDHVFAVYRLGNPEFTLLDAAGFIGELDELASDLYKIKT